MRRTRLTLALIVSVAALSVAATLSLSDFLGAGPGTELAFEPVALPPTSVPASPASDGGFPLLQKFVVKSGFTPSLHQLLEGETVITTDKQMREIWGRLFSVPYDGAQFDFTTSFVVLMGGGVIANGSFDISAVEAVEASYADPGGLGGDPASERFLSVTATTFLSGVQPVDPPPAVWQLSAVKIAREHLDDVVFRRNLILGV